MKKIFGLSVSVLLALSVSGCGYNKLQGLDEDVKGSWAEVQNQYQRRTDLIPNLVETVKAYAKHEKETLEAVISARAKATQITVDAKTLTSEDAFKKYQSAQGELSGALSRLMVVAEKYPDLKANQNFRDLQSQLEGTENRIAVARKRYIDQVAEYNKGVRFFPTNLTAKYMLHLEPRATFESTPGSDKPPAVKF